MQTKIAEQTSVLFASAALWKLGCPDLRPCEGNTALTEQLETPSFKKTPDMVAGPIVGRASPLDFYIDVANLQGETLYNPRRPGGVAPPPMLRAPAKNPGELQVGDMPRDHFDGYVQTIDKKLGKYSAARQGSPLVGLCIHLDVSQMASGASLRPADLMRYVTHLDYLRFLDGFFGLATIKARSGIDVHAPLSVMIGDEGRGGVGTLFIPFPKPFAFLCHTVKYHEPSDLRTLLIVNGPLLDDQGGFHDHPVLVWLRALRASAPAG